MPNRILKESINESRGLTNCSFFAQDLYKRLITYADDYGRFNADPQIMVARLYPREQNVVTLDDLMDGLSELAGNDKICFYTSEARKEVYGCFPNWREHQRVRESKKRAPDPTDTRVNDWYLRRFIPLEMKIAILERDKFKCSICGKHVAESTDAARLVKMSAGLFHFDHEVPCSLGGRVTMENIRLTCPSCNLSRKRQFSYEEILNFARESAAKCSNTRQIAANLCELRTESNPIQSNPVVVDAHTREDENDNDELLAISETMNAAFDAAEGIGLKGGKAIEKANSLAADYSAEWLLEAINRAAQAPKDAWCWRYIEGILRSWKKKGGIDSDKTEEAPKTKKQKYTYVMGGKEYTYEREVTA